MEDFVIATNSDNRVEAFYIDSTSTVMHTWQLNPSDKTKWSAPNQLFGTNPNTGGTNQPLTNASRIEACTDENGQIQILAFTKDNKYYLCYQTPGFWNGWIEITQS